METALISAFAAVMGSLVGGSATIATAWLSQRTQSRRDVLKAELSKRESLYGEFITESSKLTIDALAHSLNQPEKAFAVYALENRIRLMSSAPVVEAAEQTVRTILVQYFAPKLTADQVKEAALSRTADSLKPFSEACRRELADLRRGTI